MESYIITEINEISIRRLYCDFGYTAKLIGNLFGISEDAVFKRMVKYGISSDTRGEYNGGVNIIYNGFKRSDHRITDETLTKLLSEGKSDAEIGRMYGMTGEGISYRRKKLKIEVSKSRAELYKEKLFQIPKEDIKKDYYKLTQEEFSKKYNVSKTIWRPYIYNLGIPSKKEKELPPLTNDQIILIIGSLLGDGGIDGLPRYYESHSLKQEQYLRYKMKVMEPFTSKSYPCDGGTGIRFFTESSDQFYEFREAFYKEGVDGKLIPLEFISKYWDERILAYWFIDDGYYDDKNRFLVINNYCPIKGQLSDFVDFLENKLGWEFQLYKSGISFSKKFYKTFFDIVCEIATPDVLYKIPEEFLDQDKLNISVPAMVHPKFYRTGNEQVKIKMFNLLYDQYWGKPFPYSSISDSRAIYLAMCFKNNGVSRCNEDMLSFNTSGMELCEKFFPNIYECRRKGYLDPISAWGDKAFFIKLVENRLKYADRINDSSMRKGMKLLNIVVSNFKPSIARYIYEKYCKNGKILDYSAGFGSRMLAAMSLNMEYVGYEPNSSTYNNLLKFGEFLRANLGGKYCIHKKGSETYINYQDYFSLAFSSPPYFDYEIYSEEDSQSIKRFPELSDWLEKYWEVTVRNCIKALNKDGIFGFCYSLKQKPPVIERAIYTCRLLGYKLFKIYKVPFKHVITSDSYELIFLFSKNVDYVIDWCQIKSNFETGCIKKNRVEIEYKRKSFPKIFDNNDIEKKFKEVSIKMGISRETYKDSALLGISSSVIEHRYGTWNNFIIACGLVPQYKAETPVDIVTEYFKECQVQNKVLSFYEYGKIKGNNYTQKMKRLFNKGKKYSNLKSNLFKIALDKNKHMEFIKNF